LKNREFNRGKMNVLGFIIKVKIIVGDVVIWWLAAFRRFSSHSGVTAMPPPNLLSANLSIFVPIFSRYIFS